MATSIETLNETLKLNLDVQTHYNEIIKAKCAASPWKLFIFGEEDHAMLLFLEEGTSLNDFKANLSSDKVIFGLLRISDSKATNLKGKLILVYWCGQNAELKLREVSQQLYKRNAENAFSKCDRFISTESEADLETKLLAIRTRKEYKSVDCDKRDSLSNLTKNRKSKKNKFYLSKRKSRIRESSFCDESARSSMATDDTSGDEQVFPTAEPSMLTIYKANGNSIYNVVSRYFNSSSQSRGRSNTHKRSVRTRQTPDHEYQLRQC